MLQCTILGSLLKWFIFSDTGLFVLNIIYCVGGAFIFQYIEYDNLEEINREKSRASYNVEVERSITAEDIYAYRYVNNFNHTVDQLLRDYQATVSYAIKNYQYTGSVANLTDFPNGWRFPSALLFTITIVTGIGYGHVTPLLPLGQFVTTFYAVIGVPLYFLFMANTGKVMCKWFRKVYNYGLCYICWKRRHVTFGEETRLLIWRLKSENPTANSKYVENDFNTFTHRDANKTLRTDVDVWYEYVDIVEHMEREKNVPISLTLVVVAVYVFFGSVMFSSWNGWSILKGAYFCFTTLATVGFGDVVAKMNNDDLQTFVIYVYIFFGLSLLSMSFDLMIDEMKAKVYSVLSFLGMSEKQFEQKPPPRQVENTLHNYEIMQKFKTRKQKTHQKLKNEGDNQFELHNTFNGASR